MTPNMREQPNIYTVVLRIFGNPDVNPAERRKCRQASKIYVQVACI